MNYPANMDNEMIEICDAFNSIKGVETRFSCCGHTKEHWYIAMKVDDISIMHMIIERLSRIGELQFEFAFFDDKFTFGIYSMPLGLMSEFMQKAYHQWLIIQIEKIKHYLTSSEKNKANIQEKIINHE